MYFYWNVHGSSDEKIQNDEKCAFFGELGIDFGKDVFWLKTKTL